MRDLQTASSKDAIVMYHMYNQAQHGAVIAKARILLEAARDKESTESMEPFKWVGR